MPFPGLPDRVAAVRGAIEAAVRRGGRGQAVEIVAVTKTYGPDAVLAAWDAGLTSVGENKVQEAVDKMAQVQVPVRWHLLGHLQRNKAKFVDRFDLVHSVDSLRLVEAIHEVGQRRQRAVPVLLQVNTTGEASKGGFAPAELVDQLPHLRELAGVSVRGVMTMAPYEAPEGVLRQAFAGARAVRESLQHAGWDAPELSMGMSGDYEVAVEEGATMVRLGTILFGARN